jgi:hypothetical protein
MAEQRSYTKYKGYRIYIPREGNFSTTALGRLTVHMELSDEKTGDHECLAIAGCIADGYEQACQMSIEQAMLIVDLRTNAGNFGPMK